MKDQARETTLHRNAITYFLNGQSQQAAIPAGITTLEWLHDHLHLHGTKCSCNEGDCGACTVVIAKPFEGQIVYEAINSCLYPAAKLHGRHLITVEGLGHQLWHSFPVIVQLTRAMLGDVGVAG